MTESRHTKEPPDLTINLRTTHHAPQLKLLDAPTCTHCVDISRRWSKPPLSHHFIVLHDTGFGPDDHMMATHQELPAYRDAERWRLEYFTYRYVRLWGIGFKSFRPSGGKGNWISAR
ncbi:hypothetical protein BaRGS_00032843 [Batillaria attramentaria]|uniref:Uncharacterized protein n=1 Tax=Batillaria attramentaria TaxID=370345 RepID=A0ABD0JLS0_9CAEN